MAAGMYLSTNDHELFAPAWNIYTDLALDIPKVVPLTCHGHSRPVTHLSFSSTVEDEQYYFISSCKGSIKYSIQVAIFTNSPQITTLCSVTALQETGKTKKLSPPKPHLTKPRIGTFLGHKGAVWQARLSADAAISATAAADFSA